MTGRQRKAKILPWPSDTIVFMMLRFLKVLLLQAFLAAAAMTAHAGETFQLTPAGSELKLADLKPGLAVKYVYNEAMDLHGAEGYRGSSAVKSGAPIKGFMYGDTDLGQKVMTADADEYVVAFINGFMKLEQGSHELEFKSNDGLRVKLGGVTVYEHDGRHPCETNGVVTVVAPKTAWYPVEALYFQRLQTACLDLSMRKPGGEWDWTEESIYAHKP